MVSRDLRLRFPRATRHASRARKAFAMQLEGLGVDSRTRSDLERAVGEALANAVRHGRREGSYFEIRVRLMHRILRIDIEDDGLGFHPSKTRGSEMSGFGITIMRSLVDSVAFFKGGRMVRLEKYLREPEIRGKEVG